MELAEDNPEVLLVVHFTGDGVQVVDHSVDAEAAVELGQVVVVEGESFVVDGHLGDVSHGALVD